MGGDNKHIADAARAMLDGGYDGILALRKHLGHIGPHVFKKGESLNRIVVEPRYPMACVARDLLSAGTGMKLGIVARGCDVRAVQQLEKDRVIKKGSAAFIGVSCSEAQARECNCEKPIYTTFKCTGCWECVENCPAEAIEVSSCCPILVPNEFDGELS